jgi:alginate O-acetyltransferase complex protein AlgI
MVFNSLTFIVFFACVLALHSLPLPWTFKKVNLLLASYLFYAAWNPPFVILLWISTVVDWYAAQGLVKATRPAAPRVDAAVARGQPRDAVVLQIWAVPAR